jgi:DNA recombination-dependent growth factor C
MGILTGPMSVTRFKVPQGTAETLFGGPVWRDQLRNNVQAGAFRAPGGPQGKGEVVGWCSAADLLQSDFGDFASWLYGNTVLLGLRTSIKRLPMRDFKATVAKLAAEWAKERGTERCPKAVKQEIKERLEDEWLARTIPTSSVVEVSWLIDTDTVLVGSTSTAALDKVRKAFHRTFGLVLQPESPLDWAPYRTDDLLKTSPIAVEAA